MSEKIRAGSIVVAKGGRVGEARRLFTSKAKGGKSVDLAFVYFPYEHETDSMRLLGYEQNCKISDLRVATAAEKKDFKRRQKELKRREAAPDDTGSGGMKRRYVLEDPSINANKFWEVEQHGSTVTTHWGRIGAAAASKTKDFGTEEKAAAEVEKLVRQKEKKGYRYAQTFPKKSSGGRLSAKKSAKGKARRRKLTTREIGVLRLIGFEEDQIARMPLNRVQEEVEFLESGHTKAEIDKMLKAAADRLTSDEVNWLARHGWSSAQIRAMKPADARRLIAAGETKIPSADTKVAAGPSDVEQYRADLLKAGISCGVYFDVATNPDGFDPLCRLLEGYVKKHSPVSSSAVSMACTMVKHGVFTDDDRVLLVIPRDKKLGKAFCHALTVVEPLGDESTVLLIGDILAGVGKEFGFDVMEWIHKGVKAGKKQKGAFRVPSRGKKR